MNRKSNLNQSSPSKEIRHDGMGSPTDRNVKYNKGTLVTKPINVEKATGKPAQNNNSN